MLKFDDYYEPFASNYEMSYAEVKCWENLFRIEDESRKALIKSCGALVVAFGAMAAQLFSQGYLQDAFTATSIIAAGISCYETAEIRNLTKEANLSVMLAELRLNTGNQH